MTNDHSLAQRKAIGLDDTTSGERSGEIFCVTWVGKCSRARRRDAVPLHEVLRENFRRLELRGLLVHAPNAEALRLKQIDDAECERIVRADDTEVRLFLLRERQQARQVL